MFKLMGKEINALLGAQIILIWTYEGYDRNFSYEPNERTLTCTLLITAGV